MHSQSEEFGVFVRRLEERKLLSKQEICSALEPLGGREGVDSNDYYISGYECLAWTLGNKMSVPQIEDFLVQNQNLFLSGEDEKYFFLQALLVDKAVPAESFERLVSLVPSTYEPYLARFI